MAEVLLVGASRGSVDDLARAIATASKDGVAAGLHRFSFTQLAARLSAVALAERGLTPGTLLGTEAVAARAAFEARSGRALEYFGPVAGCPGFPRALARTLVEIRMAERERRRAGGASARRIRPGRPLRAVRRAVRRRVGDRSRGALSNGRRPAPCRTHSLVRTPAAPPRRADRVLGRARLRRGAARGVSGCARDGALR